LGLSETRKQGSGENDIMRSLVICTLHQIRSGDKIENEMGGARSTYGERREMYTGFWWRNLRERDHLEDPGVRWKDNIKMDLHKVGCEGKGWIDLALKMDRGRALVNTLMNLRVP
jgi:hypothetical protein